MSISDAELPPPDMWRGRDLLAKSTPLPARLNLRHTVQTRAGQYARARTRALFAAAIALIPALMVADVLDSMHVAIGTAAAVAALLVLAAAAHTYFTTLRDPTWAFDHKKWLDFTDRTWRSHKQYASKRMPAETMQVPFESMALVINDTSVEESISFTLVLCHLADLGEYSHNRSACTHDICRADSEQSIHAYALTLGAAWSIDCWFYAAPSCGGLRQIYKASEGLRAP